MKEKFLHWFAKLGGQGNSAKNLSLSFQISSSGWFSHGLKVLSRY
jgi:hypothetical protein